MEPKISKTHQVVSKFQSPKRRIVFLAVIFVSAFILRIIPIVYQEWRDPGWHSRNINEAEFYYDDVARSLIAGKGFVHAGNPRSSFQPFKPGTPFHFVPPLYAWWLYLVYLVFGPNVFIAKILQSVIDASVCLLLYVLAKRIFLNERAALLPAALYSIYPLAIVTCSVLYYQIPMNLAICWLVICFMGPATIKNSIWSGIALGATALAKPITLPLVAIMPMVRIGESLRSKKMLKPSVVWSMGFILASVITLTPWTIRNYLVFHKFVPVQHGGDVAFHQGSKEEYIDVDVDSLREKYGFFGLKPDERTNEGINNHLIHLRSDPLDYLRFLGKKFLLTWYNTEGKKKNVYALIGQAPFLFFALISLLFSTTLWLRRPNWYIPAFVLYVCGIEVIIFPLARYTLAVMPLVMIITASGIMVLLRMKGIKKIIEVE